MLYSGESSVMIGQPIAGQRPVEQRVTTNIKHFRTLELTRVSRADSGLRAVDAGKLREATLSLGYLAVPFATSFGRAAGRVAALVLDHCASAAEAGNRLLSWRLVVAVCLALGALAWSIATRPFPAPG